MYDFLSVKKEFVAKQQRYIYRPTFVIRSNLKDIMVRSRDFYALFDEESGYWITNEGKAIELIDKQVYDFVLNEVGEQIMNDPEHSPLIKKLSDTDNGLIKKFHQYCQQDLRENYISLNQKVLFSNSEIKRNDYATTKLDYQLKEEPTPYYEKLMDTLYPPSEREKIEWSVGCVLSNEQRKIQKLFVFYGPPGSGKSTVIDKIIVENLLGGDSMTYATKFTSHLLAMRDSFATGFLEKEPLVAYDDDADMSRVEDNATLNMIVSHETVRVNQKFKAPFNCKPSCLLYLGTNEPVQLSLNSGLNRRLIDIRQTGEHLPHDEYDDCVNHLKFERGGIAWRCIQTYKKLGKNHYDHYRPEEMLTMVSPFHNFVKDNFYFIKDGTTLANAYKLYSDYCVECNFKTVMTRYKFRDSLKLYFESYDDKIEEDGTVSKNFFSGFKFEKIGLKTKAPEEKKQKKWLKFESIESLFDIQFENQPAQYGVKKADGEIAPKRAWENCDTTLGELNTKRLHYVKVPENLIVIDLDIHNDDGEKSYEKNYAEALQFPPTYAELSKSGSGIHLHYIWTGGDPKELSRVYKDNIEVKVYTGNSSLRRMLTKCNDIPIAELNTGLPIKEGGKTTMPSWEGVKNDVVLHSMIEKALRKEYEPHATKPSIDFIDKLLSDTYESGITYDVRDLKEKIITFAMNSTHRADYCLNVVNKMMFCSKDVEDKEKTFKENAPIVFFDIEIFPNLFIICWKYAGSDTVVKMINPKPKEVRELFKFRLIGFNNRKYDNHMIYAAAMGYSIAELFKLSGMLINDSRGYFSQAYNLSYTDVLDFASSANKQSLKKYEIQLGIDHVENEHPWDQPVDPKYWDEVADYCCNDVKATEAVFIFLEPDWQAREMLAAISGLTVNDTTNQCTTKLLVGDVKDPQSQFVYTDLSTIYPGYEYNENGIDRSRYNPGTKIVKGKSIYRGEDPSEGGYALGNPGIYYNVALLDVASMHPHSAIALNIFGDKITKRFEELVEARIAIKHKDYDSAGKMLGGLIKPYLGDKANSKKVANALKTAINAVYGLTSAKFDNKLRDPRNVDNIVAKYGALFMINLKHEIMERGFAVAHIKTDSIKIANATPEIIKFAMDYAKGYGYTFEHEATYERMCIVNDSTYIAKVASKEDCMRLYNYIPEVNEEEAGEWTATGEQFQVPYVFKTLFSHEEIVFNDMCEVFSVQTSLYLDMNESLPEDQHDYRFIGRVGKFTPIVPGAGGGVLLRKGEDKNGAVKFSSANGAKGYRWVESGTVQLLGLEDKVDRSYYTKLVDQAVIDISKYGDFNSFVDADKTALDIVNDIQTNNEDEVPFDE